MRLLRRNGIAYIFLGVVLQSFCSIKLVWINSSLFNFSEEIFLLADTTKFICMWALVTFFARIIGGYTLGKYAQSHSFLNTQKIIIFGYMCTTLALYFCYTFTDSFVDIKHLVLFIVFFNALLFPATLVFPAMYLMQNNSPTKHARISMLVILASVIGYILSYAIAKTDLKILLSAVFGCSCLCGVTYYLGRKSIADITNPKYKIDDSSKSTNNKSKIMAFLVGAICGAGLIHNYFFVEPYILNVAILDVSSVKLGYIYFYASLCLFLILASKVCKHINYKTLMKRSLIGILLSILVFNIINFTSTSAYAFYQVLFAFFFAGFLAPSLALVFSLFRNSQAFFNGVVWYYSGISFSYLTGYALSNNVGIFHNYFVLASPLVVFGMIMFGSIIFVIPNVLNKKTKEQTI